MLLDVYEQIKTSSVPFLPPTQSTVAHQLDECLFLSSTLICDDFIFLTKRIFSTHVLGLIINNQNNNTLTTTTTTTSTTNNMSRSHSQQQIVYQQQTPKDRRMSCRTFMYVM
jgi:hypothetical protein